MKQRAYLTLLAAFFLLFPVWIVHAQDAEPIGSGVTAVKQNGIIKIVSVAADSEGAKEGLQPGDVIVSMNNTIAPGPSPHITWTIQRGQSANPITVDLKAPGAPVPVAETVTFGGIGMAMRDEGDSVKVAAVSTGSPAEKAGIQSGDIILAVDGKSLSENGLKADNVIGLVRGKVGSDVTLEIKHAADATMGTIKLTRVAITVQKNAPRPAAPPIITATPAAEPPLDPTQGSVLLPIGHPLSGAGAINAFSFALFNTALSGNTNGNVVLSPLSADLALSMTVNGAVSDTKTAMLKTLQYSGDLNTLNRENAGLMRTLRTPDPGAEFTMANGLWTLGTLKPSFVSMDQEIYGAELGNLADGARSINDWVEKNTKGKITDLVSPGDIGADTRAVLINALYFKGHWVTQFNKSLTRDEAFSLPQGGSKPCKMMRHADKGDETYYYYKNDAFEMVRLGYGSGIEAETYDPKLHQAFSMILILPAKHGFFAKPAPLADVAQALAKNDWQSWIGQMHPAVGTVSMPRLHSEIRIDLKAPLSALGMGIAFDGRADFSAMSEEPLFISNVAQKTYLDVDEEGTTAAAATEVEMIMRGPGSYVVPKEFDMVLNRPFLMAIVDNRSGAIIFLAAINDPGLETGASESVNSAQVASTPAPQDKTMPSSGTITTVSPEASAWLGGLYYAGRIILLCVAFAIAAKALRRPKVASYLLAIPNILFLLSLLFILIYFSIFPILLLPMFAVLVGLPPSLGVIAARRSYKRASRNYFILAVLATLVTAVMVIAAFYSLAWLAASGL